MFVKLQANWFGPDGRRYRKKIDSDYLTYIPDELAKFLPSTAQIVRTGGVAIAREPEVEGTVLRAWDTARAVTDIEGDINAKADEARTTELAKGAAEKLSRQRMQATRMRAAKQAKKEATA